MATLDRLSDAVVVRIVYDGPPTAGKTTSLQALAERLGQGRVITPEESAGRTVYFDWMEYRGGRFEGRQIRCQIVSVPGQRVLAPRRNLLLESADAVVFVADTSAAGIHESATQLDGLVARLGLRQGPPVGVVLQANKRDLPDAAPLDRFRRNHGLAIIESVAAAGEGIREAFVFAVRLALDRVREQMRLGQLETLAPRDESADELLAQMNELPIDRDAWATWTDPEAPRLDPPGSAPRRPDTSVASGWIWPAINGRIVLQEACARAQSEPRELTPDEWAADAEGWRFHSPASGRFDDLEAARNALIRWAQLHASVSAWTSASRCIALSETGDGGYRLWQIVRAEPSLWARLTETLRTRDAAAISAAFSEAALLCTRAAQRWAQAPHELPCTLETVATIDGAAVFVGLMPEPERVTPTATIDRRARLWQQLHALVNSELGELHYLTDLPLKAT